MEEVERGDPDWREGKVKLPLDTSREKPSPSQKKPAFEGGLTTTKSSEKERRKPERKQRLAEETRAEGRKNDQSILRTSNTVVWMN